MGIKKKRFLTLGMVLVGIILLNVGLGLTTKESTQYIVTTVGIVCLIGAVVYAVLAIRCPSCHHILSPYLLDGDYCCPYCGAVLK